MQLLQTGFFKNIALIMSGVLISVVPLLVLFFILGKQLVACVMHGAVKGWGSNPHIKRLKERPVTAETGSGVPRNNS